MPKGRVVKKGEGALYGYSDVEWESLNKGKRNRIRHPEKQRQAVAKWAATKTKEYHSLRARKSQLKLSYGLTIDEYDTMLLEQNSSCAICETTTPTGKWKVFAVDHDHTTGDVRGLLCNECNRGIGLLKDNASLLRKAADYLDSYDKTKTNKEKECYSKTSLKPKKEVLKLKPSSTKKKLPS